MSATFEFEEDNGAATGSPAKGTTRTGARTDVNWKNIDDSTSTYSSYPVQAGNNSFTKYQFGHFSGVYNEILSVLFAHTAGAFSTGVSLKGIVSSTYATPAISANASLTVDMTTAIAIASGQAVLLASDPSATSPSASTTANPAYTQYLETQLQTTTSAPAGDTASTTLTLQYNEN